MAKQTPLAKKYQAALKVHQQGELSKAEPLYRQILQVAPRHADALHGLGVIAYQRGDNESAVALFRQALDVEPQHQEALSNLGSVLLSLGKREEALACYDEMIRQPRCFPTVYVDRGNVLKAMGRLAEAEASYLQGLAGLPRLGWTLFHLGVLCQEQGRYAESVAYHQKALKDSPETSTFLNGLGKALCGLDRFDEAIEALRSAVSRSSHFAEYHHDLATAYKLAGRLDEALDSFAAALYADPGMALSHLNRATTWLLAGDYERGWPEYEWRWRLPELSPRQFPQPFWDGGFLDGRTVLLHAEQGLGDTLQFIRYAALAQRMGGRVVASVPGKLISLLSRTPGIDVLADDEGATPACHVQAPFLSLPHLLRTTLATIPAEIPYLFADLALIEHWRERLAGVKGFRIGVAWQGNPLHPENCRRSFPLAQLAPLARNPDVTLVSLQRGGDLAEASFPVTDLGDFDGEVGAFMDTAAVMMSLDLVLTADTSIAHLAGGLGVPVWIALAHVPDWRWLLRGDTTFWYPTARLFRQQSVGEWEGVFQAMAQQLVSPPRPSPSSD